MKPNPYQFWYKLNYNERRAYQNMLFPDGLRVSLKNKKSRTALLLSGQLRNCRKSYPLIKKNLIDVYDADVFLSTWSDSHKIERSVLAGGSSSDDSTIDELIQMYKPITIEVDKYEDDLVSRFEKMFEPYKDNAPYETKPLAVFMMWYKTWKVNELRNRYQEANGFKYDVIIKSRFDLDCDSEIQIIEPQPNEIYIPNGWDWNGGVNDLFALGNNEVMNYYCNMFNNLLPMIRDGHLFHPEYLMKIFLDMSGFKINRPIMDLSLRDIKVYSKEAN